MELNNPELDNSLAENWSCINLGGSSNAPNEESLSDLNVVKNAPVIYPNPAKSVINIIGDTPSFNVTIYNVTGQKLIEAMRVNQINVETLTAGMYFIEIHEKNSYYTLKFLKQ